ncbi:MAG: 3-phosphoshikimate 1-carboxyvinyltransferase [Candidatus Obscuribacterales bacterium]
MPCRLPKALTGTLRVPGDKSITHRGLIFSALARGRVAITGASTAVDCRSSADCLQALGLSVDMEHGPEGRRYIVESGGLDSLKEPAGPLDAGNSGTTIRLMAGLLAGRPFPSIITGDASLRRRTMKRVIEPLSEMGAVIEAAGGDFAPLSIRGGNLHGAEFDLRVASAQVETCIVLAGLQAKGRTAVTIPNLVRDHSRRLFDHIGIDYQSSGPLNLSVGFLESPLAPFDLEVPADISSAAFFMVAATLIPGSSVTLARVGMNPGRVLIVDLLREMGASIEVVSSCNLGREPVADLHIRHRQRLEGVSVGAGRIAAGIDELPILALAGAFCRGRFAVTGAAELRHKESDRISLICRNLAGAGARVEELPDGFVVEGGEELAGGSAWLTAGDHRLAMTGRIASLVCREPVEIEDPGCIGVSYPEFDDHLASLLEDAHA